MQACDRCYRRKSKCDKAIPTCGPCQKARASCYYVDRAREPTVRRDVVDRLERRLRQMEAKNRALASQLATRQDSRSNSTDQEHHAADSRPAPSGLETNFPFDRNEVADEVSFLSMQAGGERHYLGVASGVVFANLVQGVTSPDPINQPGQSTGRGRRQPTTQSSSSLSVAREALPPEKVARHLHQAYLKHDYLCYPFLSRHSVLVNLDRIYADVSVLEIDAAAAFTFYMVLAISMASAHKCDWQSLPESENFQARAMSRVNEVLQRSDIHALQAVLLLCQYRMTSSAEETSASLWHLVGIAARMCFELGLHRNQTYYPQNPLHDRSDLVVERETRRRCFWCVVSMDRVVSITLGRPLAINLEDVDTVLPELQSNEQSESDTEGTEALSAPIAIFNHITRYRIFSGKVMVSLHSNRAYARDEASAAEARISLAQELGQWRSESENLHLDTNPQEKTRQSSYLSSEWYELLYYNALLMLYRPSPTISTRTPTALQAIFDASREAISRYALLHTSQRINYTWITLHAVFMAGLSYIYAVGRHFRALQTNVSATSSGSMLSTDPTIMDVVNTCRSCSIVLVAVSERWATPRHCHKVFDRLSDAVLADVISFFTKPPPVFPSLNRNPMVQQKPPVQPQAELQPSVFAHASASVASMQTHTSMVPLGVDTVLRDCFEDLQHFHDAHGGYGPIRQLSQDWLHEIEGMGLDAVQLWGE